MDTMTRAVTADHIVSSIARPNVAVTGGTSITLVSRSGVGALRATSRARIRGSGVGSTTWYSSSSVAVKPAYGVGGEALAAVLSMQYEGTPNSYSGMDTMTRAVTADHIVSSIARPNVAVTGGTSITLVSRLGVGALRASSRARIRGSGVGSTTWYSSSSVAVKPAYGVGGEALA